MPRRRQNKQQAILIKLLLTLLALWCSVAILKNANALLLLVVIGTVGVLVARKILRPGQLRRSALAKAEGVVERHIDSLLRRRAQLVRSDPYGKLQRDKWTKEIEYFATEHIAPALTPGEQSALRADDRLIARMAAEHVERAARNKPLFQEFSNTFTPTDFEMFCAEQLRASGWDARVTLQSRDQGVDVIAEKAGVRVVLQCKLYSGPVGNKAVQEIVAGRVHERAHYGAVVTNNRYTSAAEELASTNGVLLLHHRDLPGLNKLIADSDSNRVRIY